MAVKFKILYFTAKNGRLFLSWMLSFYFPNLEV